MNSVLQEIYATILPSAPFIIAAYALVWLAMFVYVVYAIRRFNSVEKQLALVEQAVREGGAKTDVTASVLKEN